MADLREEMHRRAMWFYETQLRRLNYDRFRRVRPDQPGPWLDLLSVDHPGGAAPLVQQPKPRHGPTARGPAPSTPVALPKPPTHLYVDSGQPVWTNDDDARHGKFDTLFLGRMGDWLDAVQPELLAARLKALRERQEAGPFGSDFDRTLTEFPRAQVVRNPSGLPEDPARPEDGVGQAISRAEIASAKPWLIPELYNGSSVETTKPENWLANLEQYVKDFETELMLAIGVDTHSSLSFDAAATDGYRGQLAKLLTESSTKPISNSVHVGLLDFDTTDATKRYRLALGTSGFPLAPVADFTLSESVKYWSGVIRPSLGECLDLKPNSDMGLCQLVRLLYRYGPLTQTVFAESQLTWRRRSTPDDTFTRFFEQREADPVIADNPDLLSRLKMAEAKLRIILEEGAAHPHSPDPSFSILAGEILKKGLLSYKFWLDEKPRALGHAKLNQLKVDLGHGDEQDKEMEFWSENHYIMFASSEFLLGQLWANDIFQPALLVAEPGDTTGQRTGAQRSARGRARVLKWLNNRLMFGWMEFNSSGYYREHLWALLNLVDFALDEEVKTKATMVVDLMFFDVVRYLHHGAMGAAGARSQFKSKSHGFDNGLGDVVEIMLGAKGIYNEGNAQIGASFASSTYPMADVLLEIGANPPQEAFTDCSRVSITFDESPKYGITWSQHNTAKDSVLRGYAPKRAKYSKFLADVNQAIADTHDDYGSVEDDTVFFWGMSAFFNKQVVRNTFAVMHKFQLEKADVFGLPRVMVETVLPLIKDPAGALIGLRLSDLPELALSAITGDDGPDSLDEQSADDLSLFLEGSTRTRANILTYRSPGAMLSSIQNFRTGQLNFQSSVQQATLNGAVNVFVTTGYPGTDITSDPVAAGVGYLVGNAVISGLVGLGAGFIGGLALGAGAVLANRALHGINIFGKSADADGPSWWTGYWALPRVAAHRGATIMLSDFHDIQKLLTEAGSHAWFPQSGFDRVVERRTSAYDDANFALLDIGHIGPKGFWLFGKVVHPKPDGALGEPEEGYVGVFSNTRPEWLTKDSDPYGLRLEKVRDEAKEDEKKRWQDPLDPFTSLPDMFANKDWYVEGKNVWIVQVGSRGEYGSFEEFMDRVSSARVHVDDVGDLECTYDIPIPGGGADRLRLTYPGEFELNGHGLTIDHYPRFENPFIRQVPGQRVGRVEWGQREYCLEWNGKSLVHDFSAADLPVRQENARVLFDDARTIRALVIYLHTDDESMDEYTVCTASVDIGCTPATSDQVIAAGPVAENTAHDAEWIFFDAPMLTTPDMVVTLRHPASSDGDGEPSWEGSYSMKALMGDHTLRDCVAPLSGLSFEGSGRSSGPRPFTVPLSTWASWATVGGEPEPLARTIAGVGHRPRPWLLASHPPAEMRWHDHHDVFIVDRSQALWHRRLSCGATGGHWSRLDAQGAAPAWSMPFSWGAVTVADGRSTLLVNSQGRLVTRTGDADGRWSPWAELAPTTMSGLFPVPVPLALTSAVTMVASTDPFGVIVADAYVIGSDGNIYFRLGWHPSSVELWERLGVSEFSPMPYTSVAVVGECVIVLAGDGRLWIRRRGIFDGGWHRIDSAGFPVVAFAADGDDDYLRIAVQGADGRVVVMWRDGDGPFLWTATVADDNWRPAPDTDFSWCATTPAESWLFATGVDGTMRSITSSENRIVGGWQPVGLGPPAVAVAPSWLSAVCRVEGQIEVFTVSDRNRLAWTWWS